MNLSLLPAWLWKSHLIFTNISIQGGGNNEGSYADTWTIDFNTDQWTAGPQMINTRSVHGCSRLDSGLVVVAGGDGKSSVELLKPGATSWTQGKFI